MSESLKPWLFLHSASQASCALSSNFDLCDIPYLAGNRVQILRFLTFPTQPRCDVWALVGDRTHCVAARFGRDQLARFHVDYPVTFTSLKGALVTLTQVRVGVGRVSVQEGASGPYRNGQYALVLEVKGWKVVSSVREPVWYAGVKVVTSGNGVPEGEEEKYGDMVRWMKRWIRWKSLVRRAREQRASHAVSATPASPPAAPGVKLPTPAQRVLVLSSSQLHPPAQPPPTQHESVSTTTPSPATAPEAAELWTDFDLDAAIDVDSVDVDDQWGAVGDASLVEAAAEEHFASPQPTQTQTQSDPDESGLSDYERKSRTKRRRIKARLNGDVQTVTRSQLTPPPAPVDTAREDDDSQRHHPAPTSTCASPAASAATNMAPSAPALEVPAPTHAATPSSSTTAAIPDAPSPPPTHRSNPSSRAATLKPNNRTGKRQKRQAALAALMAQVVD